jgi:hypothetical protein
MAAGPVPPGRLMRKHGDTVCRVYYGGMEDSKDVDYESDSDFSESSAASSAASAEEQKLREEQQAAETVRSPTFFSDVTFVRTCVHSTWQTQSRMRRSLKILDGDADETIDDLFSTMSEVEKMGRMEQTLLRMLSVIGARKTVVEEREILEKYDDFSKDDFWLDRIFAARPVGHVCIFAPKCHPELQGPIEMCWARVKYYCARHSNHTLLGLQNAIPGAFSADNISLDLVQKWFRKGRDYMTVYKQGATGQSADKAQKTVKSHRRALSIRGVEPRVRIDVDEIIANTQRTGRRYGSDPIRTELDPVRRMLNDTDTDFV